jgi:large subunit ribosomal protein L21
MEDLMFAVVDIAGQQFKVSEGNKVYVPRLKADVDSSVTFDSVHFLSDGKETKIGSPLVNGAKVEAKILEHLKDEKVWVFKKKRRKSYQKMNGHRQLLTRIEVTKIG